MFYIPFVEYIPFSLFSDASFKKSHVKLLYGKGVFIKYFHMKGRKRKKGKKEDEL